MRPGEPIGVCVSTNAGSYSARLVRLGGRGEREPGNHFAREPVDCDLGGVHEGRVQGFASGSYVEVPDAPPLELDSATFSAWTLISRRVDGGRRPVLTKLGPGSGGSGFGLFDGADGLALVRPVGGTLAFVS